MLSGYHAGVEYHFWEGPTACTGAMTKPIDVADMLKQIQTAQAPRCDDPAMRIFGVSLAGWDLVVSRRPRRLRRAGGAPRALKARGAALRALA